MFRSRPTWVAALTTLLVAHVAHASPRDPTNGPYRTRPDTVSVATLNAWGLPSPVSAHRNTRLPAIARFLERSGFDVVGLQEVWSGAHEHLPVQGLLYPAGKGDSGLAIASTHPASSPDVTYFRRARGFDALKKKGVITSKVKLPGDREMWMVVTHLQAGAGPKNADVRRAQVADVLDVVGRLDGPAVVVGDFNLYDDPADRESEERILGSGLVDAAAQKGALAPTYRTGSQRFDRVFVRSGRDVRLSTVSAEVIQYGAEVPFLSDHLPVHVELAWEPVAGPQVSLLTP